jgi:hypothetical protein
MAQRQQGIGRIDETELVSATYLTRLSDRAFTRGLGAGLNESEDRPHAGRHGDFHRHFRSKSVCGGPRDQSQNHARRCGQEAIALRQPAAGGEPGRSPAFPYGEAVAMARWDILDRDNGCCLPTYKSPLSHLIAWPGNRASGCCPQRQIVIFEDAQAVCSLLYGAFL